MSTHVDFPVCLRLQGKRVLLVGAGSIADERGQQLVDAGARRRVVAGALMARGQRKAAWVRVRAALAEFGETT